MIWGERDCLTDLLGPEAHAKIGWVNGKSHNEALVFVASLTTDDRWRLFTSTARGQGWSPVDEPQPGDLGIGEFRPAVGNSFRLLTPWFATMDAGHLWTVRFPIDYRIVHPTRDSLQVFRCPR